MPSRFREFFESFFPFFLVGAFFVLAIPLFFLLLHLLVWGTLLGGLFYFLAYLYDRFFSTTKKTEKGRTLEHQ